MQYDLAKNFVTSDEQGRKNLQGRALEAMALFAPQVMALIGCLHVAISMYLCYAFLRPLWIADRLGGADPAMRAQIFRVLIATVVAVFSTLVCYLNPAVYFAQPMVFFAIDSIINDLCLAILALTDQEGDASAARDASGLRVGVAPDDSPGLELSDGAMLS